MVFFVAIFVELLLQDIENFNFLLRRPNRPKVRCCKARLCLWFDFVVFPSDSFLLVSDISIALLSLCFSIGFNFVGWIGWL